MLELLGYRSGNSYRAAIALYEAEIAFVPRIVDLRRGEQQGDAFKQLNPAAKVPVLVDATFVLTQSNAILLWAASHGAPGRLLPVDESSRLRAFERFFYFVTDAIAWSGAAFTLGQRGHKDAEGALEAALVERLQAAERFLADGPYMGGATFSIADIAGFTIIRAYQRQIDLDANRPLGQWFERVGSRPAVQRGLTAFDTP